MAQPIPIERFSEPSVHTVVNEIQPSHAIERGLIDPRQSTAYDNVLAKIEHDTSPLGVSAKLNRGIHAYRTDGYGRSKFGPGAQTRRDKESASYHADRPLDATYLPELKGKDIFRYAFRPTGMFLSYGEWLAEPREPEFFMRPKLALRKILGPKLHGTLIEQKMALDQSLYIVLSKSSDSSELKYFLGVLLSRLAAWYLRTKHSIYDRLYPWYTKKQLAAFPLKERDERIVQLVDRILALNLQLEAAKTGHEKASLERQIEAADRQIDRLVYELYGLTEEEIAIVEGAK
jgi:hypothetical protein